MAKNRTPNAAPVALQRLTKTTLADLVWELAAVAPACAACDDPAEVWRVVREGALQVKAPSADLRIIERARERCSKVRPVAQCKGRGSYDVDDGDNRRDHFACDDCGEEHEDRRPLP